jgi:N6-adenosine-specific RNA methylase IME4
LPQQTFRDFDSINRVYNIIYLDPPWSYRVHNTDNNGTRNARYFYKTMTDQDIIKLPIQKIAAPDCALFLWVTNPNLLLLNEIFKTWDFEFKTVAFTWVKTYPNSTKLRLGLGHYTRGGAESCFLATRGHLKVQSHSVKQVVVAPYTKHSEKPPKIRDYIVKLYGDLPRIELFARTGAPGWDSHGDQLV